MPTWSRFTLQLLLLVPLAASAGQVPADTTKMAYTHVGKVGLRGGTTTGRVLLPQLRYEAQVAPAWSLQVGAGYGRHYESLGWYRRLRTTARTLDLSVRYYPKHARTPLSDWYGGIGFGALHRTVVDRYSYAPFEIITTRTWVLEPRAQVGKQLAFRHHLSMDLYLAAIWPIYLAQVDNYYPLALELGLSVGYRH